MGRKRTLPEGALFDAVERVVRRDGPLGMTIEAVAQEAGVSKATVLYDYASKTALLQALIRDRFARHRTEMTARATGSDNPDLVWVQGLIDVMGRPHTSDDSLVAIFVAEALQPGNPCRDMLKDILQEDLIRMQRLSHDRRAALLAYLSLYGLATATLYGALSISEADRTNILTDIRQLACTGKASRPHETGVI